MELFVAERRDIPMELEGTPLAYARRFNQVVAKARRTMASAGGLHEEDVKVSPDALASFLIDQKPHYAASSWRVVRASVVWGLMANAEAAPVRTNEISAAIDRLLAERPNPDENRAAATSQTKAKSYSTDDADRIRHAALASRSSAAPYLALYLPAARLTGLRPCEWAGAALSSSAQPAFAWELVVANAKTTNGRSHGSHRTLYWPDLAPELVDSVSEWIAIAKRPEHESLMENMSKLLRRLTRELFPRRKSWPTLSSMRHDAIGRWKAYYISDGQNYEERRLALATIAALVGHGSDESATIHYARASSGSAEFPVPAADPVEIARVRQVLDLAWGQKLTPKPNEPIP